MDFLSRARHVHATRAHATANGRVRALAIALGMLALAPSSALAARSDAAITKTYIQVNYHLVQEAAYFGKIHELNRLRFPVSSSRRLSFTRGARTGTVPEPTVTRRSRA